MNPLEEIPVLRAHLEEIMATLSAVRGHHAAHDLAESFRTLSPNPKASRLTASVLRAIERLDQYLMETEDVSGE